MNLWKPSFWELDDIRFLFTWICLVGVFVDILDILSTMVKSLGNISLDFCFHPHSQAVGKSTDSRAASWQSSQAIQAADGKNLMVSLTQVTQDRALLRCWRVP